MSSLLRRTLALILVLCGPALLANAQSSRPPLTAREVMAMVAGGAVSEDIAYEVGSRGVAFSPNDQYRSLITTAGGDAKVLAALRSAKVNDDMKQAGADAADPALQHLATAGQLMNAKKYDTASQELGAALQGGARSEAGFVMAKVLTEQDEWAEASDIYAETLRESPEFTVAHAKWSFVLHRLGSEQEALREAEAALREAPDSAEAHKNAGLALGEMQKYESAEKEYQQALRLKPDYEAVHEDMGILYSEWGKLDQAIAEYKKAIALNQYDASSVRYNLAIMYDKKGDEESAVREYREAKRLDPTRIDIRQNLAIALEAHDRPAAIKEFRELAAMAPNFEYARVGLGAALGDEGDYSGAETELRRALELDPSDTTAIYNRGLNFERQGRYDEAIAEYLRGQKIDPDAVWMHMGLGRIYLAQKSYKKSIGELTIATHLEPGNSVGHDLLGQALTAIGDSEHAIFEFREAIEFSPRDSGAMSLLATLLEKKGDDAGALEQYANAAEVQPDTQMRTAYAEAQKRLGAQHRAAVPMAKAAKPALQSKLPPVPPEKVEATWRQALSQGDQLVMQGKFSDAEKPFQYALSLAEKLTPRDDRLMDSVFHLGVCYLEQNKVAEGRALMERHVALGQELYGPQSKQIISSLEMLAQVAVVQKDYPAAETYYVRALELNQKFMGAGDTRVAMDMSQLGLMYEQEKAFDKAEPMMLHALSISEALSQGGDDEISEAYVTQVQNLYLAWEKFDKAEPYARRILAMREREYGPSSKMVYSSLQTLIEIVTKLGRTQEADNLRKRSDAIAGAQAVLKP